MRLRPMTHMSMLLPSPSAFWLPPLSVRRLASAPHAVHQAEASPLLQHERDGSCRRAAPGVSSAASTSSGNHRSSSSGRGLPRSNGLLRLGQEGTAVTVMTSSTLRPAIRDWRPWWRPSSRRRASARTTSASARRECISGEPLGQATSGCSCEDCSRTHTAQS